MKLYFTSAIVQGGMTRKPCLLAMSEGELSLEKAIDNVVFVKTHYTVLSAWIDMFDENNVKQTVFHECYVNAFGDIDN